MLCIEASVDGAVDDALVEGFAIRTARDDPKACRGWRLRADPSTADLLDVNTDRCWSGALELDAEMLRDDNGGDPRLTWYPSSDSFSFSS